MKPIKYSVNITQANLSKNYLSNESPIEVENLNMENEEADKFDKFLDDITIADNHNEVIYLASEFSKIWKEYPKDLAKKMFAEYIEIIKEIDESLVYPVLQGFCFWVNFEEDQSDYFKIILEQAIPNGFKERINEIKNKTSSFKDNEDLSADELQERRAINEEIEVLQDELNLYIGSIFSTNNKILMN